MCCAGRRLRAPLPPGRARRPVIGAGPGPPRRGGSGRPVIAAARGPPVAHAAPGGEKRTGHQAVWLVPCRCGLVLGCLCVAPVWRGRCPTRWDDVVGQRAVGGSAAECFAFVERRRVCGWGPVCRAGVSPARAPLTLGCAPAQRGSPQVNPIFGGVSTSPIRHLFVFARRPYRSNQRQRPTALRLKNQGRDLGHTLDSSPPSNRCSTLDPCAQQDPHGGVHRRLPRTTGGEDGA